MSPSSFYAAKLEVALGPLHGTLLASLDDRNAGNVTNMDAGAQGWDPNTGNPKESYQKRVGWSLGASF